MRVSAKIFARPVLAPVLGVALLGALPGMAAHAFETQLTENANGARLLLDWPDAKGPAPKVSAQVKGRELIVGFSAPVEINTNAILRQSGQSVTAARMDPDKRTLRLTLRRAMTLTSTTDRGDVALALLNAPVADDGRDVVLEVGSRPEFTRLSFRFASPAAVTPTVRDGRLELQFSRPGDVDLAQLNINPPPLVKGVRRIAGAQGRLALSVEILSGVKTRQFVDGNRVIVDLLPPPPARPAEVAKVEPPQAATPLVASTTDPAPRGGVVRLGYAEDGLSTRFTTKWDSPARAAAFRRGDGLWLVFDSNAKIDIAKVPKVGRRHKDIQAVTGAGYTGVRIAAPAEVMVSAAADGPSWTFTLGPDVLRVGLPAEVQRETLPDGPRLVADFGRPGVVRWIEDPSLGDRFAAGLITGPSRGVEGRRSEVDMALMPAAQGALVEVTGAGAVVNFSGNMLVLARPGGAAPAARAEYRPQTPSLGTQSVVNFSAAAARHRGQVMDVLDALNRAAANEGFEEKSKTDARMELARYLLSQELGAEALGVLRAASKNRAELATRPEFRLMRAAASAMMGRYSDAQKDLSIGPLADDPGAALWRGFVEAQAENWSEARRNLEAGRDALANQPPAWRARFHLALGEAALRLGDLAAAGASAEAAAAESGKDPGLLARVGLLSARLSYANGDAAAALKGLDGLVNGRDEATAVQASLEVIRIQREQGKLPVAQALEKLEALRFRWRGDAIEIETAKLLGHVYADIGRFRDGLAVMQSVAGKFGGLAAARRIRLDMGAMFERLFLNGEADKLDPIQALGLFYEFKDLTPFGPDGDRIIRLLAGRLVEVDLLEQAAELLQHQVDNRLQGIAQAQIAVDLAVIYLNDRQPEKAQAVINSTRQPGMPAALLQERRMVEATALIALGRTENVIELLERDRSPEAQQLRAEAAWRQKDWKRALAFLEPILPMRSDAPLDDMERRVALRAAVAALFAEEDSRLAALAQAYGPRMGSGPDADAFDLITSKPSIGDGRILDAARGLARSDLMDRFMTNVRARLSGAPAQAQAPAPAPAAAAASPPPRA